MNESFENGEKTMATQDLFRVGNGRKLKVKASNPEALRLVIAQAEQFIQG
jgi:hypothetical protein